MPRPSRRLNVHKLLKDLGGVAAVRRKLEVIGEGAPPSDAQMRKWVQRGTLPSEWLVIVLDQARADGHDINPADYLQ